jgi:hypothetical protein
MSIILNGSTGITTPADTVTGNATVGGTLTVNGVANALGTPGTSGNVMTSNGTAWVSSAPTSGVATAIGQVPFSTDGSTYTATQKIVQGTAVASTSGTSIDFTSIPSWVKRITVMFTGVSTNGGGYLRFLLGTSGGFAASGYVSTGGWAGTSSTCVASTTGFDSYGDGGAATVRYGSATFVLLGSNTWAMQCSYSATSTFVFLIAGTITLSGALTQLRVTTTSGTDTFDAGSINILYE